MYAKTYLIHLGLSEEAADKLIKATENASKDELDLMSILLDALVLGEKVSNFKERKRNGEQSPQGE